MKRIRYSMEPTNTERAAWAVPALEAFKSTVGQESEDDVTNVTDLLADLMHYCRLHVKDVTFDDCLTSARSHFDAEVWEESQPAIGSSVRLLKPVKVGETTLPTGTLATVEAIYYPSGSRATIDLVTGDHAYWAFVDDVEVSS